MQCRFLQDLKGQEMRDESHEKKNLKRNGRRLETKKILEAKCPNFSHFTLAKASLHHDEFLSNH